MNIPLLFILANQEGVPFLILPPLEDEETEQISLFLNALLSSLTMDIKEKEFYIVNAKRNLATLMKYGDIIFVTISSSNVNRRDLITLFLDLSLAIVKKYGCNCEEFKEGLRTGGIDKKEIAELIAKTARKYTDFGVFDTEQFNLLLKRLYRENLLNTDKLRKKVRLSYVPVLKDKEIVKKEKNEIVREILSLCDGAHTVDEIAVEVGVSRIDVIHAIKKFQKKGLIATRTKFDLKLDIE